MNKENQKDTPAQSNQSQSKLTNRGKARSPLTLSCQVPRNGVRIHPAALRMVNLSWAYIFRKTIISIPGVLVAT